jgi:hypothetical protein
MKQTDREGVNAVEGIFLRDLGWIFPGIGKRHSKDEIIGTITHLAFYAGWPPAMTALQIARKVFAEA